MRRVDDGSAVHDGPALEQVADSTPVPRVRQFGGVALLAVLAQRHDGPRRPFGAQLPGDGGHERLSVADRRHNLETESSQQPGRALTKQDAVLDEDYAHGNTIAGTRHEG